MGVGVISGGGRKCQHVFTANLYESRLNFQDFRRFGLCGSNVGSGGGSFCRMRCKERQRWPSEGNSTAWVPFRTVRIVQSYGLKTPQATFVGRSPVGSRGLMDQVASAGYSSSVTANCCGFSRNEAMVSRELNRCSRPRYQSAKSSFPGTSS